jgi:2-polyprenyl-3-methyl-5-hydroxy-6-metoxy-1,4-benzoquinol methylase
MTKTVTACYLCNEKSLDPLRDFPWLVSCQNCGMVFNPNLSIDARQVSDQFYDELNMEHRRKIKSVLLKTARIRWQWLQKRVSLPTGRLLEIGCGTGEFLAIARDVGWAVEGLELSKSFREAAKTWYDLDLKGEEVFQSEFSEPIFDVVALLHVFEHLPNPLDFLDRVFQLIKPGGWLFIVVPNLSSWTDSLFGKSSPILLKRDHFFHYNHNTLQRMIARSDFTTTDIVTLEPQHHIWTSLYGYLASRVKPAKLTDGQKDQSPGSVTSKIKSNLPYWAGAITSGLLFPLRSWLRKNNRGHEIFLLCRRLP